jgi:type II secretory pathway pseudopilin PulG
MVVVVIIAIMATIAVPLFSSRMQGRRLLQSAQQIADLYRGSRARALGRGAAVMVTVNLSTYAFQVLEGVEGDTMAAASGRAQCGNLPARGCLTNNWGNVSAGAVVGTARQIEGFGNQPITAAVQVGTTTPSGPVVGVCFSPGGRTYVNTTGTWTPDSWSSLNTLMTINVTSTNPSATTQRNYNVLILPNGAARIAP